MANGGDNNAVTLEIKLKTVMFFTIVFIIALMTINNIYILIKHDLH